MNLIFFSKILYISYSTHNFYIIRMPIHTQEPYFNITIYKNFIGLQWSIGQQKHVQQKYHKKNNVNWIIKTTFGFYKPHN